MSDSNFAVNYERSYYTFDNAQVEAGIIEISQDKCVIIFPTISQTLSTVPKEFNLFLNKTLIFSFKWLPIFSSRDYWKIVDIFYKCLNAFERLYIPYTPSPYRSFNKLVTNINIKNYSIYVLEEHQSCSIQITSHPESEKKDSSVDTLFQLYIGDNLMFCSKRDLVNLSREDTLYIIQLILHKILD